MTVDWHVQTFADLASTQDYARERAEEGVPEGLAVQAFSQTSGRGRQGREWHSPMGNLYLSILLRPDCSAEKAGQIAFVSAVTVSAAIDAFIAGGHEKTLKWPNDVLIDKKKCAGILIESALSPGGKTDYLIVGMGVNILVPPEGAIALKDVCERPVPINIFRDRLLSEFATLYGEWQKDGFAIVRDRWLAQAHGMDQPVTTKLPRQELNGIFRGIDEGGALLLETGPGKIRKIASGEIFLP